MVDTIIISVITGVVSGFISSVLVTRLARFENLRSEAQRILRGLEYMQTDNGVDIIAGRPDSTRLTNIASDFYALGHQKAGTLICELNSDINRVLCDPQSYELVQIADAEWQRVGRSLKPNMRAILKPNWQV